MTKHLEDNLQEAIIKYWDLTHPKEKLCLFHVPNGGSRNAREGAALKRRGVRAGVSDLILISDRIYFLELKSPTGTLRPTQKEFRQSVTDKGYTYVVIRSLDEFIKFIEK